MYLYISQVSHAPYPYLSLSLSLSGAHVHFLYIHDIVIVPHSHFVIPLKLYVNTQVEKPQR